MKTVNGLTLENPQKNHIYKVGNIARKQACKNVMAKVDIVKVNSPVGWTPRTHHAVEQEKTEKLLHECDTQAEAISWAARNGYTVNIHRERNRKSGDQHGQFRSQ